jgi:hypothetical protein
MLLPITASLAHDETPAAEVQGRGPVFRECRQGSLCSVLNVRTPHTAGEALVTETSSTPATEAASKNRQSLQEALCLWERRSQGGYEARALR